MAECDVANSRTELNLEIEIHNAGESLCLEISSKLHLFHTCKIDLLLLFSYLESGILPACIFHNLERAALRKAR